MAHSCPAHSLVHRLVVAFTLLIAAITAARSEAQAQTAQSVAGELPGFKSVANRSFTQVDANHYSVTLPGHENTLTAGMFRSNGVWRGWIELKNPGSVSLGDLGDLGALTLTSAFVIVSSTTGAVNGADLPPPHRDRVSAYFGTSNPTTQTGVTLMAEATIANGYVKMFLDKAGLSGSVMVHASVGPGLVKSLFGQEVSPADSHGTVTVVLSPPTLAGAGDLLSNTRMVVAATRSASGIAISGQFKTTVSAFGQSTAVSGNLVFAKSTGGHTITVASSATVTSAAAVTGDLANVKLKKLGVTATFSSDAAVKNTALGLDVTLEVPSLGDVSGALLLRSSPDTTKSGAVAFLSVASVDPLRLLDPAGGLGSFQLDGTVLMVSTIAAPDPITVSSLPDSVRAMLNAIGLADSKTIQPFAGVRLATKITIGGGSGPLGKVGGLLSGQYVLSGHVIKKTGQTEFEVAVEVPTPPALPDPLKTVATITSARFFARYDASGLAAGLDATATFKLGTEAKAKGKFFVKLGGTSAAKLQVAVELTSDWSKCFGLTGFTLLKGTGLAFAVEASGGVAVAVQTVGSLQVAASPSPIELTLGGGVSVLFSTGPPVVKGFALKVEASELDLLTPVKIGQAFVRAVNKFDNATKANLQITGNLASGLKTLASKDLVAAAQKLLPTAEPLASLTRFKLTPPAGQSKASLYLATPGMDQLGLTGFSEAGVKVAAALIYDRGTAGKVNLGSVTGSMTTASGLSLMASSDLSIPIHPLLQLKKPSVSFKIDPTKLTEAAFAVNGTVSMFGATDAKVAIAIAKTLFRASMTITLGGITGAEVAMTAAVGGADDDLRLSISLDPANVIAGLKTAALNVLGSDTAAQMRITSAVATVISKRTALDDALAAAEKEKRDATNQLTQAQTELADLQALAANMDKLEDNYETAIANAWASGALDQVVRYTAQLSAIAIESAALTEMVKVANAAVTAASGVTEWAPVRLHPDVIAAQGELDAARIELEIAKMTKDAQATVRTAVQAMSAAAGAAIVVQSFKLENASLKDALDGKEQTFTVKVRVNNTDKTYTATYKLKPPSLTFAKLAGSIVESAGAVPTQAEINKRISSLDLGYGDVRLYRDKNRAGTASWAGGQRVGAAGWGELAVAFGGWEGKIYGITYGGAVVMMVDGNDRAGTTFSAHWSGPTLMKESFWKDYTLDAMTGGWKGYTGLMSAKRFVIFKDFGQVYVDEDFDPGTDANGNYFSRLFGGHDHVYYLTSWNGDLYCYKPGYETATGKPVSPDSDGDAGETYRILEKVSSESVDHWNEYTKVFGGENGVIYGVKYDGGLYVRKHKPAGRANCSDQWEFGWLKIGDGWDKFQQVLGGEDGMIYAVPRQALPLTPKSTVGLYAPSQQRFLRALDTNDIVDGSDLIRHGRLVPADWGWERWKVVDAGGGLIALWNPSTGRFMVSTSSGEVELSATLPETSIPAAAKFQATVDSLTPRGHIRLRSDAHNKFVYLNGRDAALAATRDATLINGYANDVFEVIPVTFPAP